MGNSNERRIRQYYGTYVKLLGRKSKHINGYDPNDRTYDREFEKMLKMLPPEELARILDEEDALDGE